MEERGTYHRWVLTSALAGMFATSFPITILSVSLSDIAVELDSSTDTLTWVITGPMLLSALMIGVLGKLGDLYGHRRVFLWGFALSTAVSAATALAWNPASLIALRCCAQVIGAATQPTSMALVMLVTDRERRVKALGWWQLVAAGAPSVGLALGGPLVDAYGWRPVFVIQAALATIAVLVAFAVLPTSHGRSGVRFDVAGSATLLVGVGGVVLVLGQVQQWGVTHPVILGAAVVAPVALVAFWTIEKRVEAPLVPPEFFHRSDFSIPLLTFFFQGATYMGGFVLVPLVLRNVFGYAASATAGLMLLRTGVFSLSSPFGGWFGSRYGSRTAAMTGMTLLAVSMVLFVAGLRAGATALFATGLVAQGLGAGTARPSLAASISNAVPDGDLGIAAALQRMTNQIGNVFGITAMAMLARETSEAGDYELAFATGALWGVIAVVLSSRLARRGTEPASLPDPSAAPGGGRNGAVRVVPGSAGGEAGRGAETELGGADLDAVPADQRDVGVRRGAHDDG